MSFAKNESQRRYPFVKITVAADVVEQVSTALWEEGVQAVEERDGTTLIPAEVTPQNSASDQVTLVGGFLNEDDARAACERVVQWGTPELQYVEGDEWRDAWKKFFHHAKVGHRLVVGPPWESWTGDSNDIVVTIDPGRAFGSGLHETTRLLLRFLDENVREECSVLDVGTGSGILSIAALKLGARAAVATDIDTDALVVAKENAQLNGVAESMRTVPQAEFRASVPYAIVVANIQANVLSEMAEDLARWTSPGGLLAMSGILRDQADDVRRSFSGMELLELRQLGEWVAPIFRKKTSGVSSKTDEVG